MAAIPDVRIREMRIDDIPAGLALCRASRWNQTDRDWRHFLTAAPHGALVAVDEERVIGTVATLPYGPFTWISMVLVDPSVRGRGVGTLLLERGLDLVPQGSVARLDATPAGEGLYRRIGFAGEYALARWYREAIRSGDAGSRTAEAWQWRSAAGRGASGTVIRPFAAEDWRRVRETDVRAFGAPRGPLLERLVTDAPEYAWLSESEGELRGYLFGRHGHVREHLGPLVADGVDTARLLLDRCLASHPDRAVFLDVPDDRRALGAWLQQLGFRIERPFLRMSRGTLTARGRPESIHAIAGPEYG